MWDQLTEFMTKEAKDCINWAHSKENQGQWLRKTIVSLRFRTDTSKMIMMLEVLEKVKKDLANKNYKVKGETVRAKFGADSKETLGQGTGDVLQGFCGC